MVLRNKDKIQRHPNPGSLLCHSARHFFPGRNTRPSLPSPHAPASATYSDVPGMIRDTLRLGRDAIFWNTRKTWHILRGRRSACPCQVRSDSGRARETGCEAAVAYESPARFRRICPLLVQRPAGGWVCSVNAEDVRPFWGRALLLLGGAALATVLLVSISAFALMRGIGYDISYRQLVWPPAWSEFSGIQADLYRQRAIDARSSGRIAESLLLLSNAYELQPSHYPTGIQLAQLWQTTQPLLSDRTYARLMLDHPDRAADTAQAWFRALLARGDFGGVQRLAGERILRGGGDSVSAWLQAFVFSTRQLREPEAIDALLRAPGLPPSFAPLLASEREFYLHPAAERAELASRLAASATDTYTAFHWLRRLLDEGRAELALPLLSAPASKLGNREKLRLQLDALATLGRDPERETLVLRLLERPTSAALCELLSSHLAQYPSPVLLSAYAAKLERDPLPADDARYPQLLAFFAACASHRDEVLMKAAADWLNAAAGREYLTLAAAREAFMRFPSGARLESLLPALQPMPLETTYALYARFSPPPPLLP